MMNRSSHPPARHPCAGLTLLEMIISTGLLSLLFLGVGATVSGNARNTRHIRTQSALLSKAQEILDACRVIPFGSDLDASLKMSEIQELFDGDPRMGDSSITLHALQKTTLLPNNQGRITLLTGDPNFFPDGFPVQGKFKIKVIRAGSALLARAITEDPLVYSKLRNGTLDNDLALKVTVLFEDARDSNDRILLETHITDPELEGASE